MSPEGTLELRNRLAAPLSAVPRLPAEMFHGTIAAAVAERRRIVSLFGMPEGGGTVVLAVLADDDRGTLAVTSTAVDGAYRALTPRCPEAHLFEREIAEQCGVALVDHPNPKPVRRRPGDQAPGRPARPARPATADLSPYPFDATPGEDVHEVAVGPVHAGIIEPGHFRFQAHGETVLALEVVLGYQHRGVERLLETTPPARAMLVAESIAGDTVIGHAEAYCGAIEALSRCRKTPRAQAIRGIALELERLANHLGDLGALAGDIAYQPAAAFFGRMRGDCANLLLALSGNRYGRGLVRPGGAAFDLTPELAATMRAALTALERDMEPVARLMFESPSVQARLEGVGRVPREACGRLGLVGPTARACEVPRDVRHDHPYGIFRFAHSPVATAWAGDVLARALVRWLEVQRSLEFVMEQVSSLPRGAPRVPAGALRAGELVVAMTEGWRGEIAHVVVTDGQGRIRRHKVTDPSFHNWSALAAAMPGNQISDFPLCNKSFNLSYAGHDL